MVDFLKESGLRAERPSIVQAFMPGASAKYEADIKAMKDLANRSKLSFPILFLTAFDPMDSCDWS